MGVFMGQFYGFKPPRNECFTVVKA